jgi:hypothetical protein
MSTRRVTLYDRSVPGYSRHVWAVLGADGGLTVSGQSLSRGDDLSEYEWAMTVAPAGVPVLTTALAGDATAGVLDALVALFAADGHADLQAVLNGHEIPYEFWSRVGD